MLGREVVRAAAAANHAVVALTRDDLDVGDAGAVERVLGDERPDAVVNCAAYTDVDGAERDPDAAMAVNGAGAGALADAAAAIGAAVVYPSTDYVFDGRASHPYVESDPTAPATAYGTSKLAGEHLTAAANPRHHIARTSWLFGIGGGNFVETMLRLGAEREVVDVVTDQVGSPTYAVHLAAALVTVLESRAYGVWHLTGTGSCTWFELARATFARAGMPTEVRPTTAAQMARPAPRPAYSVLASERREAVRLPHWLDGLAGYLAERAVIA
jgi:dTDP-4-dehydrorhamnose reductase